METVKIFIGTEPKTEIALRVLIHSIKKRTKWPVEITPMIGDSWTYPTNGISVGTGFSLRRWMIPAACGWQGKAIYLDADQLVLADIAELWNLPKSDKRPQRSAWTTYQPTVFSKTPIPNSSVMVIDCENAYLQWGWHIKKVLAHLSSAGKDKTIYHRFMTLQWMQPPPGELPVCWNHLDKYVPEDQPEATKILHYTSEPDQPWYNPVHPCAKLWRREFEDAILCGAVTLEEFERALSRWNVREDHRKQNGLHPSYAEMRSLFSKKTILLPPSDENTENTDVGLINAAKNENSIATEVYLAVPEAVPDSGDFLAARNFNDLFLAPEEKTPQQKQSVLFITSFNQKIFDVSGKDLLKTFTNYVAEEQPIALYVGVENCRIPSEYANPKIYFREISNQEFLKQWLRENEDIIPEEFGGKFTKKWGPQENDWFRRNACRWFRKLIAIRAAAKEFGDYSYFVWVDADCTFHKNVTADLVRMSWFRNGAVDGFVLQYSRFVPETGVFGVNMTNRTGVEIINELTDRYKSGNFREDPRWDDSYQLHKAIEAVRENFGTIVIDLANYIGPFESVVEHSVIGEVLTHAKGTHGNRGQRLYR